MYGLGIHLDLCQDPALFWRGGARSNVLVEFRNLATLLDNTEFENQGLCSSSNYKAATRARWDPFKLWVQMF